MQIILPSMFLAFLLAALQVQACWYVDSNFERKPCGEMPRTQPVRPGCEASLILLAAAKRDVRVVGFEKRVHITELEQLLKK